MDTTEKYIKMCEKLPFTEAIPIINGGIAIDGTFVAPDGSWWHYNIPLYTQDQLQEMVYTKEVEERYKCPKSRWLAMRINKFWESHEPRFSIYQYEPLTKQPDNYCDQFSSMEQLWLAFVMHEKYKKTWNGEEWVSVK
jgi:hypothetical protein